MKFVRNDKFHSFDCHKPCQMRVSTKLICHIKFLQVMSESTIALFARAGNRKLLGQLAEKGNKVIQFPSPELQILNADAEFFYGVSSFDWIIFNDVLSVEYYLQNAESVEMDLFDLDALRICAVGEAVADRLRFNQIHADLIPPKTDFEAIYSSLSDYIADDDELVRLNFLIVCQNGTLPKIAKILEEKQASVCILPIYEMNFVESETLPKLKAMLIGGAVDAFIFTSPAEILYLKAILATEKLNDLMADIKITATDQITRKSLAENDLQDRKYLEKFN